MKMALQGGTLLIKDADNVQFTVIKSWNKMKWDKKSQVLRGTADIELLDKLASIVRLPPAIEDRRTRLHAVQDAVDQERVNQEPKPFYKYPVKLPPLHWRTPTIRPSRPPAPSSTAPARRRRS